MLFQEYAPHLGLREHIRCYWTLEPGLEISSSGGQSFLAEGLECSFNLGDPVELAPHTADPFVVDVDCISGPMTRPTQLRPTGYLQIFGICFRPGRVYPFIAHPAHELVDGCATFEEVWASEGATIATTIQHECGTTSDRVEFLNRHFLHWLDNRQEKDSCVVAALDTIEALKGDVNISRLARMVGLSSRELERRFKDRVGLSPKQLCRNLRFKRVLQHLTASPTPSWVSAALDCGYYDQSHMIREFKHYTGTTPAAYFANREGHPEI